MLQELSSEAQQGLQDLKQALQAASVQRHDLQAAAAAQPAPHPAAGLAPQPAALTNVPEQVAAAHNEELKNRAPQYQHIPRNVYSRGVARPKRQPRDDIHVCNCQAPSGLFGALPARQPTQRQANSSLHKQMLQRAAAGASSPGNGSPALASHAPSSHGLPHGQATMTQGMCDVRMTENAADQATPGTQHTAPGQLDGSTPHGCSPACDSVASPGRSRTSVRDAAPALQLGCGEDCLNRLSFIHCDPKLCPCGDRCSNRCDLPVTEAPLHHPQWFCSQTCHDIT